MDLQAIASTWTTPQAHQAGANSKREERGSGDPDLKEQAEHWKTLHGMGTQGFRGKKSGAGGEFAKQANQWSCTEYPATADAPLSEPLTTSAPDAELSTAGTQTKSNQATNEGTFWGTPNAHERTQSPRDVASGIQLAKQANNWQTPATDSFRSRGGDRKDEMGLDQQARTFFPTPASRDYRTPNSKPYSDRGGGSKGEQLQNFVAHSLPAQATPGGPPSSANGPTLPRRLNPRFVEWLMGFPIGWTELCKTEPKDSRNSATRLSRKSRNGSD